VSLNIEGRLHFGKADWRTYERAIDKEWLVTNGLGGFASGTIIGLNTRKYHGLLFAALNPPVERVLLLSKIDERVEVGGRVYNLAANETTSGVSEFGYIHLQRVVVDRFPYFFYSFADIFLEKSIFMVYEENTTVILYHIKNGKSPAALKLDLLTNCRGYHYITSRNEFEIRQKKIPYGVLLDPVGRRPQFKILCGVGEYFPRETWFNQMTYAREKERGENPCEDHFMPGYFIINLRPGEERTFSVVASTGEVYTLDGKELLSMEKRRAKRLVARAGYRDPLAQNLSLAADSFIVKRKSTGAKTIIAGYHWFTDWGRDAMISLPGLTLATGRYDDAREILLTFARYVRDGLLPNMFHDEGRDPLYNTVDASLWYFQAVYSFLCYTKDYRFVRREIYPALKGIIENYARGTLYNIGADQDGLLKAGSPGQQLTWMDAKVDGWVVTPRHGKPVEINALWYNALCILERLAVRYQDDFPYRRLVVEIKKNFPRKFWNDEKGCLFDVVDVFDSIEGRSDDRLRAPKDPAVRPNQLMAVSLPFSTLSHSQGKKVVLKVWQDLYVSYGLRSLSSDNHDYHGRYLGDRVQRDAAYHQGTAWSWLIGPFISAYRRVYDRSPASRVCAARFLLPFCDHLTDAGVGYISEIFDGDEPVTPRGCIAQAWGVAEVLRVLKEDVLEDNKELTLEQVLGGL